VRFRYIHWEFIIHISFDLPYGYGLLPIQVEKDLDFIWKPSRAEAVGSQPQAIGSAYRTVSIFVEARRMAFWAGWSRPSILQSLHTLEVIIDPAGSRDNRRQYRINRTIAHKLVRSCLSASILKCIFSPPYASRD
jgi:hypothetical protein